MGYQMPFAGLSQKVDLVITTLHCTVIYFRSIFHYQELRTRTLHGFFIREGFCITAVIVHDGSMMVFGSDCVLVILLELNLHTLNGVLINGTNYLSDPYSCKIFLLVGQIFHGTTFLKAVLWRSPVIVCWWSKMLYLVQSFLSVIALFLVKMFVHTCLVEWKTEYRLAVIL